MGFVQERLFMMPCITLLDARKSTEEMTLLSKWYAIELQTLCTDYQDGRTPKK